MNYLGRSILISAIYFENYQIINGCEWLEEFIYGRYLYIKI